MRWISAAVAVLGLVGAASAQGPAEPPPFGFKGREYVDSRGCVFVHAAVGGATRWVPMMSADRKPVCVELDAPAAPEPAPVVVVEAAPPPAVAAPRAAPRGVAAAAPRPPVERVASAGAPTGVPRGYKLAWDDGRLNASRGPRTAEGDAQMARLLDTSRVPMRPAKD